MEQKQFDFQKFQKENYWYERGFDLRDIKTAPIPATLGEGHCFEIVDSDGVRHFETRGDRTTDGKRRVRFSFSTLRGVSFNATHYYCKVCSYINNVCIETGGWVGGYLGGHKVPQENCSMEFQLANMIPYQVLNEKEEFSIFGLARDWQDYADENGMVLYAGFDNYDELHALAHQVAEALFPDSEWEVEFEEL